MGPTWGGGGLLSLFWEGETTLLPPSALLGGARSGSGCGASAVTTSPSPAGRSSPAGAGARRWSPLGQPEGRWQGGVWRKELGELRGAGKEAEGKSRVRGSTFMAVGLLHMDTHVMLTACEAGRRQATCPGPHGHTQQRQSED